MFSYDAKIFVPKQAFTSTSSTTVKAFATLIVDGVLEIKGFKVMQTGDDLWIAGPREKGSKAGEDGRFPYFDSVLWLDEKAEDARLSPRQAEVFEFIKTKYIEAVASGSRAQVARARHAESERGATPRDIMTRKNPMWGDDDSN